LNPPTDYALILTDQPGAQSWPITGASFILVNADPADPAATAAALKFFDWSYTNGATMATERDYVLVPMRVAELVRARWRMGIKGPAASSE
jgi:phosphate transport system substrate-binding protein